MRFLLSLPAALSLLAFSTAAPAGPHQQLVLTQQDTGSDQAPTPEQPLPLLVWHGLGDRYDADGLHSTGDLARKVHPGTFVYYIRLDSDGSADRTATFFGNATGQGEQVCSMLQEEPELLRFRDSQGRIRADALGFSQGGQFLRGLVERCGALSVRSLVTFGSQHNGIAQFQKCGDFDFLCKGATAVVKGNAWTDYVQHKIVPAQYYRPLNGTTGTPTDGYLEHSSFLADINNERRAKNGTYAARLSSLDSFVMFVFEDDETVIPRDSGHWAEVNATSGEVTPLRETTAYLEDWVGLRTLDEKGGLVFESTPGAHMELDATTLKTVFGKYFGPEAKGSAGAGEGDGAGADVADATPAVRLGGCGADEAQARWDRLGWWEKLRFDLTHPWL
ncbi:alpha/beta-hydrolase [Polychaeton citri CBS 116435]|uniref:palmitoyl-protein hydrolase n=1 Tax=Polychaeton citri CBS 116435 TaxID=1314669 RepID=A0A9P4URT7_9PEZI|nr:alpha/beta-hydrolase [Polychaeton citri CBS 116435]